MSAMRDLVVDNNAEPSEIAESVTFVVPPTLRSGASSVSLFALFPLEEVPPS